MKTKYCVTTATSILTGNTVTGIFTWTGKNWRMAKLGECVKVLPAGSDLQKEYKTFMKNLKATEKLLGLTIAN